MSRPLYRDAALEPARRPPGGHAGLWFDKFCDRWRTSDGAWTMRPGRGDKDGNPKFDWIRHMAAASPVGDRRDLDDYALRRQRLVASHGGRSVVFEAESRFVTGLGRSHPVENGFAWHPTLGAPFLPGSSVKGLARAWAESEADPRPDRRRIERAFGTQGRTGTLCFLDAIPLAPVRLEADVMTPHYAGWSPEKPPGDWMSPVPIPFLAVAAGARLLFSLLPRRASGADDLDPATDWLASALEWAGAGAKTAVGYGRFVRHDAATRALIDRAAAERARTEAEKPRRAAGAWRSRENRKRKRWKR